MCDADKTLETFRLVKKDFPHVMLCLSSNGLAVPDYVNDIADLGITHVTITANAIDPEIAKMYIPWFAMRVISIRESMGLVFY